MTRFSTQAARQIIRKGTAQQDRFGNHVIRLHNGLPYTDSLILAQEFGRRHDNVLQSLRVLIAEQRIGALDFKDTSYRDLQGKKHNLIELTERGALIAMPFIGGRKSREGQARLVDAFLAARTQLQRQTVSSWHVTRKNASIGFLAMSDALCEARTEAGKATSRHHYVNEARLVNWILFSSYTPVDRDRLPQADLHLLEAVEVRNAVLIANKKTYDERKRLLQEYRSKLNSKAEAIQ